MSPIFTKNFKKFLFLVALLTCNFSYVHAQPKPLSDQTKVSIITCGAGEQLHALFGHTAIRINDPEQNLDVVFNYGTFDFDTSFFYLKFVRGNLDYFLSATDFSSFIAAYRNEQRDVFEQELIASTKKKQKLFQMLLEQLNSDKKYYRYKFIDQNCTTMVKDKLEEIWSSDLLYVEKINIDELSYRSTINLFLEERYFERLGINILFGSHTDQMANKIFLPEELMASLTISKVAEDNIVQGATILYKAPEKDSSSSIFNSLFFLIFVLVGLYFIKKISLDMFMLQFFGFLGLFLGVIMVFTDHNEVWWNYNILLFNPLLFVMVYATKKLQSKLLIFSRYAYTFCILIYTFFIFNTDLLKLIFPFLLYALLLCFRLDKYNVSASE